VVSGHTDETRQPSDARQPFQQNPLDADPGGDRDLSVMGFCPYGDLGGGRMLSAPLVLLGPSSMVLPPALGGVCVCMCVCVCGGGLQQTRASSQSPSVYPVHTMMAMMMLA